MSPTVVNWKITLSYTLCVVTNISEQVVNLDLGKFGNFDLFVQFGDGGTFSMSIQILSLQDVFFIGL